MRGGGVYVLDYIGYHYRANVFGLQGLGRKDFGLRVSGYMAVCFACLGCRVRVFGSGGQDNPVPLP